MHTCVWGGVSFQISSPDPSTSQPRCPNIPSAVGLYGLQISSTYSSLGMEKQDFATQQVLCKLSSMTGMMETYLLFSFPRYSSPPNVLQFIRTTKISEALVLNFAISFLPPLRVRVPGLISSCSRVRGKPEELRQGFLELGCLVQNLVLPHTSHGILRRFLNLFAAVFSSVTWGQ